MFWRKKEKNDWPVIVLVGFGSLVFLTSIIIFVIGLFRLDTDDGNVFQQSIDSILEVKSPVVLEREYFQEIGSLVDNVKENGMSDQELIDEVEKVFFHVRVPADLRESHMKTFFDIQKLKESESLNTDELLVLLGELLK